MNPIQKAILREMEEPVDLTYMGIGSCPHFIQNNKLDTKNDQLVPLCFHEHIIKDKKSIRILHFDPAFSTMLPFLHTYFETETWNCIPVEFEGVTKWVSDTMEVIVVSSDIDHEKDFPFLHSLCETILNTKGKLVIQEYTGYELQKLNQKLFEKTSQQKKFKRRILLDMTFETNQGCCTDMSIAQPYYDYDGNFLNLHFLHKSVERWIGVSLKLDELLRIKYRAKYFQALNNMHVDYRRRLRGEKLLYGSSVYTENSSPDDIMKELHKALLANLCILVPLCRITTEKKEIFDSLFTNYKEYDPYKWYNEVVKLV